MDLPPENSSSYQDKQTVIMRIENVVLVHPEKDILRDAKGEIIGLMGSCGEQGCSGTIGPQ